MNKSAAPDKKRIPDIIREFLHTDTFHKCFCIFCSMLSASAFARYMNFSTANILTLLLAALMFPMYRRAFSSKSRLITCVSLLCGLFFTIALFLHKYEWLLLRDSHTTLYSLEFSGGFMLFFTAFSGILLDKLQTVQLKTAGETPPLRKQLIVFFSSAAILFVCWFPYFLLLYPGDITADSISELNQAVKDEALSNHHPIAHTMMIRACYSLGFVLFHDETKAVATYSVIQMLLLAFGFSYLITTLYKLRVKKLPIACVFLCYALLSYHAVYSTTMWKDVMFGFFVLTFSVTLWRVLLAYERGVKRMPVFEAVMLFVTGIGVCLFRSNGMYTYMMTVLFLAIFCIRKKKIILLSLTAGALAVSMIIKGPVYGSLNITPPDTIEGLAMPQQMIAMVVRNERPMTMEQFELISNVCSVKDIMEKYTPNSADSIKMHIREHGNQEYIAEHKNEFLKLWIDLGLKYPSDYVLAFVYATEGYWYPDIQNWVYAGEFRHDNFEDLHKEALVSESAADLLFELRDNYNVYYFLGLFWSIGLCVWVSFFMAGVTFTRHKLQFICIYLPVIGVWETLLLAAPVFAEFRYTYSIFCTVPLLSLIPFIAPEPQPEIPAAETAPAPEPVIEAETQSQSPQPETSQPQKNTGKKHRKK